MTAADLSPSGRARSILDDDRLAAAVTEAVERAPELNADQVDLLRRCRLPVPAASREVTAA